MILTRLLRNEKRINNTTVNITIVNFITEQHYNMLTVKGILLYYYTNIIIIVIGDRWKCTTSLAPCNLVYYTLLR